MVPAESELEMPVLQGCWASTGQHRGAAHFGSKHTIMTEACGLQGSVVCGQGGWLEALHMLKPHPFSCLEEHLPTPHPSGQVSKMSPGGWGSPSGSGPWVLAGQASNPPTQRAWLQCLTWGRPMDSAD